MDTSEFEPIALTQKLVLHPLDLTAFFSLKIVFKGSPVQSGGGVIALYVKKSWFRL